jgi:23S rRNA (adenine2030-N6)-methyltransferase
VNYRHIYHAGNFADVFKHVILVALMQALVRKENPFCYLDTHAGIGCYDLQANAAQKTKEFETGISRILAANNLPSVVQDYLTCVKSFNNFYPGSPCIARYFLRPQDKMILTELHAQDAQALKQEFKNDKQVAVHQQDGYQALKAFLPPKERRGLVLIDPPYEKTSEFEDLVTHLQTVLKRWSTGVYAIWYPLKDQASVKRFKYQLKENNIENILFAEFSIYPEDAPVSLNGCGMAIINPPWQLDEELKILLPWLWKVLSPQSLGTYRINK